MPIEIGISTTVGGIAGNTPGGTPTPPPFSNVNSFSFDGVDEYFLGTSTYSELDGQNKATISFWAKFDHFSNARILTSVTRDSNLNNFVFMLCNVGNSLRFFTSSTSEYTYSNAVLTANAWLHIMIAIDKTQGSSATRCKIFINGQDETSSIVNQSASALQTSNSSLYIGENQNGKYSPFLGNIDEFAIWSGTDLRNDVATIYNNGEPTDLNNNGLTAPTTWQRMGEDATWNGATWTMTDVNGGYSNRSINMVEANRTTDVPPNPPFANTLSTFFDGVDEYFLGTSTYSELDSQNNFTFSFWIKPTNLNNTKVVFSIGNGNADTRAQQFFLQISATGQMLFYLRTMSYYCRSNNSAISSNQWHHVLICRNHSEAVGSKAKIFVNSVDVTNNDSTRYWSNTANATTSLYIGEHTNGYANPFLGNIDEFAIWSGTDLRNDVATIYNSGVPNDLNNNGLTAPTTWQRMGEDATWNGTIWTMTDVNGSYTNRSINMVEANRTTDVPPNPFANTQSILLDGVDDYVQVADADNLSFGDGSNDSPFSISTWWKMDNSNGFRGVQKYSSSYEYRINTIGSSAILKCQLYDNSNTIYIGQQSNVGLSSYVGQWIHVVMTYDGSSLSSGIKLYLNGSLLASTDDSNGSYTAMHNTTSVFRLGNLAGNYADGLMDETAVFNSELSQSDVTTIYNGGVPNDISSLSPLSWWRCGDGDTSPTLTDNGSGGNDGTMTNFSTFSTDVPT